MTEAVDISKQLPFRAEYAKSGRAKCKGCSGSIEKAELRLAKLVQSSFFDGMQASWFHFACFFSTSRPKSVGDIAHFETLRYEDQERIQSKIGSQHSSSSQGGAGNLKEFKMEYAKSSKAVCPACENPLKKQELRIGKIDYDADAAIKFGIQVHRWYHVKCFVEIRDGLEFFVSGTKISGYRDLEQEDQEVIKQLLPASKKRKLVGGEESKPSKKSKEDIKLENEIKKQNQALYKLKDEFTRAIEDKENQLKIKHLKEFLDYNDQEVPVLSKILDRLVDVMIHGVLKKCTVCKSGQYVYRSGVGYFCLGNISEFAKCANITEDPERVPFRLPKDIDEEILEANPFLKEYKKGKVIKRIIPKHAATVDAKSLLVTTIKSAEAGSSTDTTLRSSAYNGPRVNFKPLAKFRFVLDPSIANDGWTKKIEDFGGKLLKSLVKDIAAFISIKEKVDVKDHKFMSTAKARGIPVVAAEFIDNIREADFDLADVMSKHLIVDWIKPNEVKPYLANLVPDYEKKPGSKEEKKKAEYEMEMKKIKLKMKNGAVVDPDSGLEESGHVYKEGKQFYTSVLNKVDVEQGKNSYYKCQIIESDRGKNYWIYRAWGRVGTSIGGKQTDPQPDLETAKEVFHLLYKDRTLNEFGQPFKRRPDAYVPMDIDFGEKKQMEKLKPDTKVSKLELPVQTLVCKIFDVENMQKTLVQFELDLEKMPLGKISRKQIMEAYTALSDTMKLLEEDEKQSGNQRKLIEVTNRFFTLIPHNFGVKNAPLLNDVAYVKTKLEMLENLLEIELAYELLLKGDEDTSKAPVDAHYDSLKCSIRSLEKSSQMWQILDKYLHNTHAPTHMEYALEITNIFAVDRKGENKRYKPFKDLHNRKLLWHGSRTANYAGILSQGLRIAPPEAPVTGYMFGKGIYFADMVSKSANYCYPSRHDSSTGLLLLCEVALGDMAELTDAKDTLVKAPKGKHSVKGLGITIPDPSDEYVLPTGVVVPYGKPSKTDVKRTSLLYNEYIVYDINQVNILYMVEVKFKYNRRT